MTKENKIYLVTRHEGAKIFAQDYARKKGFVFDKIIKDFDPDILYSGDHVYGILPIHLAYEVCRRNAMYWHLIVNAPLTYRGNELTADDLNYFKSYLRPVLIQFLDNDQG